MKISHGCLVDNYAKCGYAYITQDNYSNGNTCFIGWPCGWVIPQIVSETTVAVFIVRLKKVK